MSCRLDLDIMIHLEVLHAQRQVQCGLPKSDIKVGGDWNFTWWHSRPCRSCRRELRNHHPSLGHSKSIRVSLLNLGVDHVPLELFGCWSSYAQPVKWSLARIMCCWGEHWKHDAKDQGEIAKHGTNAGAGKTKTRWLRIWNYLWILLFVRGQ